jgi:DNA-binding MarR family transcriptional regulator
MLQTSMDKGMSDRSAGDYRDPPQGVTDASGEPAHPSGVAQLAEVVEQLMHQFLKTRQQMLVRARQDVDWSTQLLLSGVVAHGPMRVKELAGLVQSDPSTVSRQVAQLVRDGFLERRADAVDGRASLLTPTDKARKAVDERKEHRNEQFERMLLGWDDGDRERLAALLGRFLDDFLTYKNALAGRGRNQARTALRKETRT